MSSKKILKNSFDLFTNVCLIFLAFSLPFAIYYLCLIQEFLLAATLTLSWIVAIWALNDSYTRVK